MLKRSFFLLLLVFAQFFAAISFAKTNLLGFMTPQDILSKSAISNINLQNNSNSAVTVYGLYVRQFSFVNPGDTCAHATVMYPTALANENTTGGAFLMPTVINAHNSVVVGNNYLYNMIYEAIYYLSIIGTTKCLLPGCTWPTDTTTYNWCIYLGALAPVTTSDGYTANVPPEAYAASNGLVYDYNLVSNYIYLGPISCDDQTLSCTVVTQQTQSFS